MYCSQCGKKADDGDRFCSYCGNKLKYEEVESNIAMKNDATNRPTIQIELKSREQDNFKEVTVSGDQFVGNTEKIIEEVRGEREQQNCGYNSIQDLTTKTMVHGEQKYSREKESSIDKNEVSKQIEHEEKEEFAWNIYEFDRPASNTENVYVDWKNGKVMNGNKEEGYTPVTIDDIQKDIEASNSDFKKATAQLEKFYTFNKKNEEFQKLLDKEYERIYGTVSRDTTQVYLDFEKLINPDFDEDITYEEFAERLKRSKEVTGRETYVELPEFKKIKEECAKAECSSNESNAPILTHEVPVLQEIQSIPENVSETGKGQSEHSALTEVSEDGANQIEATTSVDALADYADQDEEADAKMKDFLNMVKGITADSFENQKSERDNCSKENEENSTFVSVANSEIEDTELYYQAGELNDGEISKSQSKKKGFETAVLDELFGSVDKDQREEERLNKNGDDLSFFDNNFDNKDHDSNKKGKNEKKKRGKGKKIAIAIILIIAVMEVGILALNYFAPESQITQIIYEKSNKIIKLVTSYFPRSTGEDKGNILGGIAKFDSDKGLNAGDDESKEIQKIKVEEAISAQSPSNNENIASITVDYNLGLKVAYDYKIDDLNSSIVLSQKYSDDEKYNKILNKIVATLIAFDSSWIDYTNESDKKVFQYLKSGSEAEMKYKGYRKAGSVYKQFQSLKIGEIRAGEKGYYVWATEEITTIENGTSKSEKFNWIYYMEYQGNEIKISKYIDNPVK